MASQPISFVDPEIQKCPFPHYAAVRDKGPFYIDPVTGFYVLTSYDLVRKATTDTTSLSSKAGQIAVREGSSVADEVRALYDTEGWMPVHSLVNNDPPDHARFRSFVDRAFLPARMKTIEGKIARTVDDLISQFASAGKVEFMEHFAFVLPLRIFGDEFGVPEADHADWRRWTNVLLEQMNPVLTPERELELTREVCGMQRYLIERVDHYRKNPEPVLLSDLVQAADDGRMNTAELLSVIQMLVPAGHETTANALGSGMRRLAEDHALQDRLRADPSGIPTFVDEVLRLDAPVQGLFRIALRDIEIGGIRIPKGSTLVLNWGAANRDPAQFERPDRVDLGRTNSRRSLTFGAGAHFCVGSQLARAELQISFDGLIRRLARIRLSETTDAVVYRPHFFAYGPAKLEVEFECRDQ